MLAFAFALLAAPVPPEATAAEKYEAAVIAAIHHFARENEPEHLDALLTKHPNLVDALQRFPNPTKPSHTDVFTPLHWAARGGCTKAIDVLLNHRAKLSADSSNGWTALHIAVREGHLDAVKLLVARGADVGAKTKAQPEREVYLPSPPPGLEQKPVKFAATPAETALDVAVRFKQKAVAEHLRSVKN